MPPSAPSGAPPPSVTTNGRLSMDGVAADATTNAVAAAAAGFGETDYQASTTSHGRELPPWGSGLGVTIPPPNT